MLNVNGDERLLDKKIRFRSW